MSYQQRRVKVCAEVLEQLEEAASESMPVLLVGVSDPEANARWVAERNRRTELLVQLYCAHEVSSSVGSIGPV